MAGHNKNLVLAADVTPEDFAPLVEQMDVVPALTDVKLGFEVGLGLGLENAVGIVHESGLHAVYDHQKGGNDIPGTGMNFARAMKRAGVDAAILFPFAGPVTQERWTKELQERGIQVISGAEMTHPEIEASTDGKSGGYVNGVAFSRMFELAVELGVRDFVVPGNKPEKVTQYRELLDREIGAGEYRLWAPGFVTQGGDISETGAVAGPNFSTIVGSDIYKAENPREAAIALGKKILELG